MLASRRFFFCGPHSTQKTNVLAGRTLLTLGVEFTNTIDKKICKKNRKPYLERLFFLNSKFVEHKNYYDPKKKYKGLVYKKTSWSSIHTLQNFIFEQVCIIIHFITRLFLNGHHGLK